MAVYGTRSARLVRELSRLDTDELLLEGVLGIWDQSTERILLTTDIKLTGVLVDNRDKALKFYPRVLGFVKKSEVPAGGLSGGRLILQHRHFLSA